ncbi:MAG: T9SS type B sorting domain-containing protein [Lutibacter sp.]|nr:T9SS type B sorting domain-containing protein [Lutibacter sp.]
MYFKKYSILFLLLLAFFISNYGWAQTDAAPTITATGDQIYCPLTPINVVTFFDITDPDDTTVATFFIQISEGYKNGEDKLTLLGSHPNITTSWSAGEGKLTLKSSSAAEATYIDIIAAVKEVVFESSSPTVFGEKKFSFTIGDANYLPSTGHFYEYVEDTGITWTNAKTAAASRTYFGLKGYLATITSAEEAKLSGEQAAGAGWIGGSDAETEGTWKWVTGPEAGKTFYKNGTTNGTDIPFAFWNTGEPNNLENEDYAHVTAPGVGILGSWNDLSNTGAATGNYQPRGYIVEYGGTPGDPILNLSASTTISVAAITTTTPATICGAGTLNLSATATNGATVLWFDSLTSTTPIFSGTNFTTPLLSATTTYYVLASVNGCLTGNRKPVIATIYAIPTIISAPDVTVCEGNSGTINAMASSATAIINWYGTPTGGIPLETGNSLTVMPTSTITTYYIDATENGCTTPTRTAVKMEVLGNTISLTSPITLNDIAIIDDSNNNSITINNFPGFNNYDFNLNSFEEFGNETYFEHLEPGIHFLYLRNKTNCEISKLDIAILGFPKFFTPNGDGQNDTWKVLGNNNNIQISAIYIFDRFGKLVAEVDLTGDGWDGFYNGERLPTSDYWYLVKYLDQYGDYREKRGNFSLIRR